MNNSLALFISSLVFVCVFRHCNGVLSVNATPEYIHPCTKASPKINDCIKQTFNHLRKYLIQGIDEIAVPSIEPLIIPAMKMENGHGAVRYRIDLALHLPHIEVTGNYDVNGNVLLFPVRSRGDFWAAFGNVTGLAKLYATEQLRNETKFMKTERLGIQFKLSKSNFKIKDFINRNNVIGEAMNIFLNQNAAEIIEEMKPAASAAIGKHFKSFLNAAFLQIPLKVWLRDAE
ncbi:hypothetical protein M8J76_012679 [Diaphorina citri]|nr:hypothetical protein M8J76_012679 [Diaphorina citri]